MAKYDVKMSCGHVETVQLFGKMEDRRRKIAWLEENGVCPQCRKAQKEQEHAEATAKAVEKASAENLPDLTGTEKQVNWALVLRAEKLAKIDETIEKQIAACKGDEEKIAFAKLQGQAFKNVFARFTEARFWIDNRDCELKTFIKNNSLADEIKAEIETLKTAAESEVTEETTTEVTEETTMDNNVEFDIQKHSESAVGAGGLDENCTEIGYLLGRVFATCQRIVNIQQRNANVYSTKCNVLTHWCTFPLRELALLQTSKVQPALTKIKARNADLAKKLEVELAKVMEFLPPQLPHTLGIGYQQYYFSLGYYHQLGYLDKIGVNVPVIVSRTKAVPNANLQKVLASSREVIDDLRDED